MSRREIEFAGQEWLVLDEDTGYIVRKEPLPERWRFDPESNDFETSEIKRWLNDEYLRSFTIEEFDLIDGEIDRKITLLSVEEAEQLTLYEGSCGVWWWLRSRGTYDPWFAAHVSRGGEVDRGGWHGVSSAGGVRPALHLRRLP